MELQYKDLEIGKVYVCKVLSLNCDIVFLFSGRCALTDYLNLRGDYNYGTCASGSGNGEGNEYRIATTAECMLLESKRRAFHMSTSSHRSPMWPIKPHHFSHFNYLP